MKPLRTKLLYSSLMAMLCLLPLAAEPMNTVTAFANLKGEVLLDNARVHVQRFVIKPGQATGAHSHRDGQLLIYIRGGVLKDSTGRAIVWKDGRVQWFDGDSRPGGASGGANGVDAGATNSGSTDIEIVCVTLKPLAADAKPPAHKVEPLGYPNIPGEDLLENDFVIVQRFLVKPGQWEGVHAHQPNMLFVHVKGGQWAARSKREPEHAYPHPSPDGEVGWMDTIDINVGHESGNIGPDPIDLIWVSLRK